MATRSHEELNRLTQSVLSGIEDREAEAKRRQHLSPDKLRHEQAEDRISKRAWGESTTDLDIQAEQRRMAQKARREGFGSRKTVRGQVSLIGTPPEKPDR